MTARDEAVEAGLVAFYVNMMEEPRRKTAAVIDAALPVLLDGLDVADLAEAIWNASRADEGTISALGADIVADAVIAHLRDEWSA